MLLKHGLTWISSIVAPGFLGFEDERGFDHWKQRRLRLRVLKKRFAHCRGCLVQDKNRVPINPMAWRIASAVHPLVDDWETMILGVKIARHLQSSACLLHQRANCLHGIRLTSQLISRQLPAPRSLETPFSCSTRTLRTGTA